MTRRRSSLGFSLIELMVAMTLGTLISAAIVGAFVSASNSYATQTQLARLQEEGRFAITQIRDDLAMAGAQYCNNSGGQAHAGAAGIYMDAWRLPKVYVRDAKTLANALSDVTTRWTPPDPFVPYPLPAAVAMRGYDCTLSSCSPLDPSNKKSAEGFGIPAMGIKIDDRVPATAVLTVRYINPAGGWQIMPEAAGIGSTLVKNADGSLTVRVAPMAGEPALEKFAPGDPLAMLADCSGAQIFAVTGQSTARLSSTRDNAIQPMVFEHMVAPRLFDLSRDFQTVTYYLKIVDNGDGHGHTTGALVRRLNGGNSALRNGSAEEIARGVERLDFRYGVRLADGSMRYYDAAQVDASNAADCALLPSSSVPDNDTSGCLWRAVSLIEIDMLLDGQQVMPSLRDEELAYTYASDDSSGVLRPMAPADASRKVTPLQQGFPLRMLRREVTAVVALRNLN